MRESSNMIKMSYALVISGVPPAHLLICATGIGMRTSGRPLGRICGARGRGSERTIRARAVS